MFSLDDAFCFGNMDLELMELINIVFSQGGIESGLTHATS